MDIFFIFPDLVHVRVSIISQSSVLISGCSEQVVLELSLPTETQVLSLEYSKDVSRNVPLLILNRTVQQVSPKNSY